MAIAPLAPAPLLTPAPSGQYRLPWADSVWRAPLVPVALALTAGIVLDRYAEIPLAVSLTAAVAFLAAAAAACAGRNLPLPLLYLAGTVAALGAAYHHWHRHSFADDDL